MKSQWKQSSSDHARRYTRAAMCVRAEIVYKTGTFRFRSQIITYSSVDISTTGKEELSGLDLSLRGGQMKRSTSVIISSANIDTRIDHTLNTIDITDRRILAEIGLEGLTVKRTSVRSEIPISWGRKSQQDHVWWIQWKWRRGNRWRHYAQHMGKPHHLSLIQRTHDN